MALSGDVLQPTILQCERSEPKTATRCLKLLPTALASIFLAAQRDRGDDYVHLLFSEQAQREPPDDAFVVRVG
jgi:hypothetical protein